ncbi:MAG: magnesium chelatase subunit D [Pseudomonadota bacterium]
MSPAPDAAAEARWRDAEAAAALLAVDPVGLGGVWLRARVGPTRALWVETARRLWGGPVRRLPATIGAERLLGALDLAATLREGAPRFSRGFLAECDGALAIAPMAERLEPGAVGPIAAALDRGSAPGAEGSVAPARFGLIALDEGEAGAGEEGERLAPALSERLGLWVALSECPVRSQAEWAARPVWSADQVRDARARLASVAVSAEALSALIEGAARLGADGARTDLFALRAARASAALGGREAISAEDLALAGRLTIGPRATRLPEQEDRLEQEDGSEEEAAPEETPPDAPPPDASSDDAGQAETEPHEVDAMADAVIEAAAARLPEGLLQGLSEIARSRSSAPAGASGARRAGRGRGRAVGAVPGRPGDGARLDLLATLRAAVPWRMLRGGGAAASGAGRGRLPVRMDDLRIVRTEQKAETVIVFAVDASGSTALNRLGEAKGAVELLLAESYARRDQVALVCFRGARAELALPPTRSLTRAKRLLSGLPGGGGTPLASGVDLARAVAEQARRAGRTPTLVVLTDGQANVARSGLGGRVEAMEDALSAARATAATGLKALVIDASPRIRPGAPAEALAAAMGARYLPLPRAEARAVTAAVRALD